MVAAERVTAEAVEAAKQESRDEAEKIASGEVAASDKFEPATTGARGGGDAPALAGVAGGKALLVPTLLEGDPSTTKAGYCASGDAFKGIGITVWRKMPDETFKEVMWLPAGNSDLQDTMTWEDEYNKGMKRIVSSHVGGDSLKAIAHEEKNRLIVLRHKLFCNNDNLLF